MANKLYIGIKGLKLVDVNLGKQIAQVDKNRLECVIGITLSVLTKPDSGLIGMIKIGQAIIKQ
ncbi:MAG: hypothetical protein ACERIH_03510 [Labilibaculum antarcticum]